MKQFLLAGVCLAGLSVGMTAIAAEGDIKIGLMTTLEGTYTVPGQDGQRGFEMALKEHNNTVGGKTVTYVVASTDASPDSAVRAATKLVQQDGVKIIVGPLSGSEGLAMRDFARQHPDVTVINGISGAQETTMVDPAPNFYRFNMDGAQWGAGLGDYVVNKKGWKTVATLADDYSFGYTNFMGFALGFCNAGGKIEKRFWVPLGTKDFASIISALPDDVDAIFLGLGGGDAVNFLNQYQQAGGSAHLIGGTIMADQSVFAAKGNAKNALIGTPSSGPQADTWDNAGWKAFVKRYQDDFPADQRFASPSLFAVGYYNATTATLDALDKVKGDLGDGQKAFRDALAKTDLKAEALPVSGSKIDESALTPVDEIEDIAVGATPTLTVTLAAGHYVLLCNIETHFGLGMRSDFDVN